MARFSGNPSKDPLSGTERMAATDMDSGNDCYITPDVLTQYVQENMGLANGTSQGAMSGAQATHLDALPTAAELTSIEDQLGQIPFPIFIGSPVDGSIEIYKNVLDNDVVFDFAYYALSSGSTTLTVTIDGTPITGLANLLCDNTSKTATATAAKTLAPAQVLGLTFASSGSPTNLRLSLKGDITRT